MDSRVKILIGVLVVGIVLIGGLLIWNKLTPETKVIDDEKYCEKDLDCVFLDFIRCCPPPDPCKREAPMVVNIWNKEKIEQEMKAKCPPTCPYYEQPQCSHCFNIEKFTPICVDNKCTVKREINCEEYCKAVAKNESEPCPWISNPDLITEENTEKCGCKKATQIKYKLWGNGLYKEGVQVIESKVITKEDSLPKELIIDKERIVIKQINVKKTSSDSFSVYLILDYKGKEEKIGFWYRNPDPLNDQDGCGGLDCGGVLTIETKIWKTEPSDEDKKKGVRSYIFIKYIGVIDIDYDFKTNDWNYIEIGTLLYKENEVPPTIFE